MHGPLHPTNGEADTHYRILQAALDEFSHNGYKGSSTRVIADRAGVNEVTLFRHFGSKLELLRAAVEDAVQRLQVPSEIDTYLSMSFREGFGKFISDYLMQLSTQSDILMLGFAESFTHPQVAEVLKRFMWKIRSVLLEYFTELHRLGRMREADLPVLTQMVMALIHGTPAMRKRAPTEVTSDLTDVRIVSTLVETVVSAYSLEKEGS